MFIVLPALFLILFLSSMVAFACTRFWWRFNVFFLVLFTAGNLMPQQVIFQPLFQMYKKMPWPDLLSDANTGSLLGTEDRGDPDPRRVPDRVLHVRAVELHEDDPQGAQRGRRWSTAPACRASTSRSSCRCAGRHWPRSATLEFTWLYNDFFWGAVLLQPG